MKSGIYGWFNTATRKWYVGQSVDIEDRRKGHVWELRNNRHFNKRLQEDFNFYGETAFEHHILEEVTSDMFNVREKSWIAYHKSNQPEFGYNRTEGGNGWCSILEETRLKMSQSHKGVPRGPMSAETRARISAANKGKKKPLGWVSPLKGKSPSAETRAILSAAQKRRGSRGPLSPEWRAKISAAHKGKKVSMEQRVKTSATLKGRIFTPEWRTKISAALKGRKKSPEAEANRLRAYNATWAKRKQQASESPAE